MLITLNKIQVTNSFILCATSDYENIFSTNSPQKQGRNTDTSPHPLKGQGVGGDKF